MNRIYGLLCGLVMALLLAPVSASAQAPEAANESDNPQVTLNTSKGDIRIELYPQQAPATVENFLQYARDGYYAGTVFHRVISHFMIQGGGLTADMTTKPTADPVVNDPMTSPAPNIWGTAVSNRFPTCNRPRESASSPAAFKLRDSVAPNRPTAYKIRSEIRRFPDSRWSMARDRGPEEISSWSTVSFNRNTTFLFRI